MSAHPALEVLLSKTSDDHVARCEPCTLLRLVTRGLSSGKVTSLHAPASLAECLSIETLAELQSGTLAGPELAAALAHLRHCRRCLEILHDSLDLTATVEVEIVPRIVEAAREAPPADVSAWRDLLSRFLTSERTAIVLEIWESVVKLGDDLRHSRFGLLPLVRWPGERVGVMMASRARRAEPLPSFRIQHLPLLIESAPEECSLEVRWAGGGEIVLRIEPVAVGTHVTITGVVAFALDGEEVLRQPARFEFDGRGERDSAVQPWPALVERFPADAVPELALSWSFENVEITSPEAR